MKIKKIKVAMVDNHKIMCDVMTKVFENNSKIEFIGSHLNGYEFISSLDNFIPDVVLMDINMPGMDGSETTKLALSIAPKIIIIGFTMHNDRIFEKKMLHSGASFCLAKTDDTQFIIDKIIEVMENRNVTLC